VTIGKITEMIATKYHI